jgi:hypothetical protein
MFLTVFPGKESNTLVAHAVKVMLEIDQNNTTPQFSE